MYYVYFIKSTKYDEIYVGSTNNLRRRLTEHNDGVELSTKRYRPWRLVYYEAYQSEEDARNREMKLKHHGNAMRELKKRIQRSLENGGALPRTVKNGAGFTLIEVLMVVFLLGIVVVIGSNLFFSILKGASKAEVEKEVKQNGDYAMNVMERMVRNAQNCSEASGILTITNPDGNWSEFKCLPDEGVTKIASESALGTGYLTGKNVTLGTSCPGSLSFSCDQTKTPPVVNISFDLSQKGTVTRPEEKAQIHFQTTVGLRTY